MFHNFYLSALWSLLVNAASNTFQIQQWNTKKRCRILKNEDVGGINKWRHQRNVMFLMYPCQWVHTAGCKTWNCFNMYLSKIYFIWYTARYTMGQTCVTLNITRDTISEEYNILLNLLLEAQTFMYQKP